MPVPWLALGTIEPPTSSFVASIKLVGRPLHPQHPCDRVGRGVRGQTGTFFLEFLGEPSSHAAPTTSPRPRPHADGTALLRDIRHRPSRRLEPCPGESPLLPAQVRRHTGGTAARTENTPKRDRQVARTVGKTTCSPSSSPDPPTWLRAQRDPNSCFHTLARESCLPLWLSGS